LNLLLVEYQMPPSLFSNRATIRIGPSFQAVIPDLLDYPGQQRDRLENPANPGAHIYEPDEDSLDRTYEIEYVTAKRRSSREGEHPATEYLVKWKGYSPSCCTWEPLGRSFVCVQEFEKEFECNLLPPDPHRRRRQTEFYLPS